MDYSSMSESVRTVKNTVAEFINFSIVVSAIFVVFFLFHLIFAGI